MRSERGRSHAGVSTGIGDAAGAGPNRQRVDAIAGQITERTQHHPLPHQAGHPFQRGAFDDHAEMRFAAAVIARMAVMLGAVVDDGDARGGKSAAEARFNFLLDWTFGTHHPILAAAAAMTTDRKPPPYSPRFHGRMPGDRPCAHPGCEQPGEFRAPAGKRSGLDGPGEWQWLCLEHVRAFNAGYNYFAGMSPDEIAAAQTPYGGWERETRAFASTGADAPPQWQDFRDPLDAIGARFADVRQRMSDAERGISAEDRQAYRVLGLEPGADLKAVRSAYTRLARAYHPDRHGGDRRHEKALQAVIAAYTHLKSKAPSAR